MADHDNPFAPSEASATRPDPDRVDALDPVPMDVGEILSRCWQVFTSNTGVVLAAIAALIAPAFVFGASGFAINLAIEMSRGSSTELVMQFVSLGNSLLQQLVTLFLSLGAIRVFLHVTRGQPAEASMIVGEARSFLPAFGAQLLIVFAALATMAPGLGALGAAAAGAMDMESALLVTMANIVVVSIPWVVVGIGLQFVQYVIVDRGVGPIDAIRESWRLTSGYKLTIFFINFLAGLLGIVLTCLTLGIGYLLFIPVLVLMQGVMYHSLTHYQGLVEDPW